MRMVNNLQRGLKVLSVITTLAMLFILLGGALVTKTGSGMGCGRSWPLCHGELIPSNITPELIIELAHRVVTGVGGFIVLALCIWSWIAIGHIRETKFLSIMSLVFLVLQALLGAGAVVWGQSDIIMALHFGVSLVSFASVLLLTLLIFEVDKKLDADNVSIRKPMRGFIYGTLAYSFIVVYSGAFVRHTESSLACPDVPFCYGTNMPTQFNEWVQMAHRLAAGLIFVLILIAFIHAAKHYKDQKNIYYGWLASLVLVCLQALSGVLVVYTKLSLFFSLSHSLFISCLFGVLSYLVMVASRDKKKKRI